MSLKCGECGLMNWSAETSCAHCGAHLSTDLSGGVYSESEARREPAPKRQTRPFFKALLYSLFIELVVLVITIGPIASSFMSHSAAAPRNLFSALLATFGFFFHFPSILIAEPLDLFPFIPLIQIALMTALLTGIIRRHRSRESMPRSIFR